jgi:hypothetical protein
LPIADEIEHIGGKYTLFYSLSKLGYIHQNNVGWHTITDAGCAALAEYNAWKAQEEKV